MARLAVLATLIVFLVAIAMPGCSGKVTTTTSPAPTTTSLANTSTSGQSSSTAAGPTTTAGMPWQEVVSRFTKSVTEADLPGTLPYSMLPDDEVAWLLGNDVPVHPTQVAGFKFANGDLVILCGASMLLGRLSDEADIRKAMSDAEKALQKVAEARYQVSGKTVHVAIEELNFGVVVVAGQDAEVLWSLANAAHM
jgi:hypothetical protein